VLLTDDTGICKLNRDYRGIDAPTDVLSFPLESRPSAEGLPILLGDIAISVEMAARQAQTLQMKATTWGPDDEVEHLIIHGMLHLLGYDDATEEGAEEMRVREEAIRAALIGCPRARDKP